MFINSKWQLILSAAFTLTTASFLTVTAQTVTAEPALASVSPESVRSPAISEVEARTNIPVDGRSTTSNTSKATSDPIKPAPASATGASEGEGGRTSSSGDRQASDPEPADRWQFQLTPYLWLPSLQGTTGTDTRQAQLDASFSDIFHSLKFAFMGTFEARRKKLGIVTDLQYVSLSDDKATPGPLFSGVKADVKTFIFDPEVAYRVFENSEKGASVDLMGGIRIVHVSTDLTFLPGILVGQQVDASRTWVDAVVGMRFKAHLSPKIFVMGKFDLGGGGSKFAFQLLGGLGYEINQKVALMFGYRDLDINYRRDNFIYDTSQRGPIMGVAFRF